MIFAALGIIPRRRPMFKASLLADVLEARKETDLNYDEI